MGKKARSPRYPAIGLKEAIEKVTKVYEGDYQNAIPRSVVATHMGYESLNGKSLGVLSACMKYGLLEGRGDNTRVSDLAVAIIAHVPGTTERIEALQKAASEPDLFGELDQRFQNGKASDQAIRSYLLTQKFIPEAADTTIRSYRETKQLVEAESGGYTAPNLEQEASPVRQTETLRAQPLTTGAPVLGSPALKLGQQHAVFPLAGGEVSLSYPAEMSASDARLMASYVNILLKQVEQLAEIREKAKKNGAAN